MNKKFLTIIKVAIGIILIAGLTTACSNSINVQGVDEENYSTPEKQLAYLTDKYGASMRDSLLFNVKGATNFYVNVTTASTTKQEYSLSYDATVLKAYNDKNKTNYQALPEDLVTIEGTPVVEAGDIKSNPISVKYNTANNLEKNGIYAIPLRLNSAQNQVSKEKGEFVLFVQDITKMPNCHKHNGLQVISCMEINDSNPLYNLCFTLQGTGQYFFDQVILFSGNINYNLETQEVYNYNNENISHVLQYKEKYLEPLQQKGMKVILGILGNHDRAAITNLSVEGCKHFAQELKAKVEAYNLDGVFFDDEYSNTGGSYPGFVSGGNASRLCYETKKAMPNKLVQVYVYGGTTNLHSVEGKQPGEFVDCGIHDYGGTYDLSNNYPGMPKSGMFLGSVECARNYASSYSVYARIKSEGYGGTMVFGLDPKRTPLEVLNRISQAFYGANIVQTGIYRKDW